MSPATRWRMRRHPAAIRTRKRTLLFQWLRRRQHTGRLTRPPPKQMTSCSRTSWKSWSRGRINRIWKTWRTSGHDGSYKPIRKHFLHLRQKRTRTHSQQITYKHILMNSRPSARIYSCGMRLLVFAIFLYNETRMRVDGACCWLIYMCPTSLVHFLHEFLYYWVECLLWDSMKYSLSTYLPDYILLNLSRSRKQILN